MPENLVVETHIELWDGQARFKTRNLKVEPVARMHVNGGATIEEVMGALRLVTLRGSRRTDLLL